MKKLCGVENCGNAHYARGVCHKHYQRWSRLGVIECTKKPRGPLEMRFFAKVQKADGDACWPWSGAKTSKGYGAIQAGGKGSPMLLAHRLSYELHYGPIPEGAYILHSCDNPGCVNPSHLRAGTQSENILEAFAKGRKKIPQQLRREREEREAMLSKLPA